MALPFRVASSTLSSSLQGRTPIRLSPSLSFIAILPLLLILVKSSNVFFLTFPFEVANTIISFFHSDSSSGKGMIELIEWWLFKGKILNIDLPFEAAVPSGILCALILYTRP